MASTVTIKTGLKYLGCDNCILLSVKRGKLNTRTIAEALEHSNMVDCGAYAQLHVKSYDEVDCSIYDDGDDVMLVPLEDLMKNRCATAQVPMMHKDGTCQCCGTPLDLSEWSYCPVCGQAFKTGE